jgi:hypothetical protein
MIDPKTLASVAANTDTDLHTVTAGKRLSVLGLLVTNYSGSDATVKIMLTDAANVVKAYWFSNVVKAGSAAPIGDTVEVCSKSSLRTAPAGDKVRVFSSQANVSFQIDGTED